MTAVIDLPNLVPDIKEKIRKINKLKFIADFRNRKLAFKL